MKAVKRIVVLGATAGLIMAGAGAATANDGHHPGKSQKKYSKHHKSYKSKKGHKHHKFVAKKRVVHKNNGAQALVFNNEGAATGTVVQGDVLSFDEVIFCGNAGGILAAQNAAIGNSCENAEED